MKRCLRWGPQVVCSPEGVIGPACQTHGHLHCLQHHDKGRNGPEYVYRGCKPTSQSGRRSLPVLRTSGTVHRCDAGTEATKIQCSTGRHARYYCTSDLKKSDINLDGWRHVGSDVTTDKLRKTPRVKVTGASVLKKRCRGSSRLVRKQQSACASGSRPARGVAGRAMAEDGTLILFLEGTREMDCNSQTRETRPSWLDNLRPKSKALDKLHSRAHQ